MLYKEQNKGEQRLCLKINKWKVKGKFDILGDISENFTSVQLMDTVVNVNHAVIISGHWIFYFNYKSNFR